METPHLLTLPLEIRRPIIVEVLKQSRGEKPVLSKDFVADRVRLRNRFDENYPLETAIFVRRENGYINGNGLLATNRQLRQETHDLIEYMLKTGRVEVPFVLDVMVVKDVGILPTWMSYPYQPTHLKQLLVDFRIFRPDKSVIPENWVPATQEVARRMDHYEITISEWNIMVVLLFYAMGRCTSASKNTVKAEPRTLVLDHLNPLTLEEQPEAVVDTYISAQPPYLLDELILTCDDPYEHYANGAVIMPFVEDWSDASIYKREGYWNFGRTIFRDEDIDAPVNGIDSRVVAAGQFAASQLMGAVDAGFCHLWECCKWKVYQFYLPPMKIYLDAVARNIRAVNYLSGSGRRSGAFAAIDDMIRDKTLENIFVNTFSSDDVVKAFKNEKKKKCPDENMMHFFRLVKRRMDLGWWDDARYKECWNERYRNGWYGS